LSGAPSNSATYIGFRCTQTLADLDPEAFNLTAGSTSIAASWDDQSATGYLLVRGATGSAPSFTPVNGVSYGTGAQGSDTIVYDSTGLSFSDTGLTEDSLYSYALYSYDGSTNYTAIGRSEESPFSCPTDWVKVPASAEYGTPDFCVMKYEAKDVGDIPTSQATDTPWVSISQEQAKGECAALGAGYELISNDEWMAIASNIAAVGSNWDGGTVGTDSMNRGHSDNDPGYACDADQEYVDTDCDNSGSEADFTQKRTHTLSNSEVIWDMSGNVWDWTSYYNQDDKPYQTATDGAPVTEWREYTLIDTSFTTMAQTDLISAAAISGSWSSTQGIGQYYAGSSGSGGALHRGAGWGGGTGAGPFAADLPNGPSYSVTHVGFRCVRKQHATLRTARVDCSGLSGGTWVGVPGDADYGTADFCIMKYEAKNVASAPESNAADTPWVSISQTDSITECQSLGTGYNLISNDQWMTAASNIASVSANWSGGAVGSGALNRGHSDNDPTNACDGTQEYVDTDCDNGGGESAWVEKRTHTLADGGVVWDLSGNVWDWTSYVISDNTDKPYASSDGVPVANWREYTLIDTSFTSMAQTQLRPTNALKSFWDDSWNSAQSVGQYFAGVSSSGGALPRGAPWNGSGGAGVFAAYLNIYHSTAPGYVGFRCARQLP
jgi:formylglycine-generating enzyme required for sulfatase activity